MAANQGTRLMAEPLRELAAASINDSAGAFVAIGSEFSNAANIIQLINTTDRVIKFSLDGVNAHYILPINGMLILDITTNKSASSGEALLLPKRSVIYARSAAASAPSTGSVYLSVSYASSI